MSSRRSSHVRRVVVAALAVLAVAASACSNAEDRSSAGTATPTTAISKSEPADGTSAPGVTADEIRFAAIGTRENNPLGTCLLDCFLDGINAYFAYRNDEGGVDGRKLVVSKELDDQVAQNKERSLEVVSSDDVFGVFDVPLVASGYADLGQAGIPVYSWAINFAEMTGQKSIFGNVGVVCASCVDRSPAYAAKLAKAKKVAIVGYGVAQVSKDCVAGQKASVEKFAPETGQEVVYANDSLPFGLPNGIGPEVTAMKQAGAEVILSCWDLKGVKSLEQEMERQGMGDVPQFSSNLYDAGFVATAPELFEGDIVRVQFRPFEAESATEALGTYRKWMGKTGSELSEVSMFGWINADLAYQGLKAAGPDPSRAAVIEATNKMTDFSADGLVNPIDWSRQHEPPTADDPVTHGYADECYSFVRVKDGKFELVGDPKKPFMCWPVEKDLKWSEPVATDVS